MRLLCIAEKPSVSRELQKVYNKYGHPQHQIEFAAFHGHLMKLPDPEYYNGNWKAWSKDTLPIIPNFVYVENDKESCRNLMDKIKNGHFDGLINACDAGREGEHIFGSFYDAHKLTLPVFRLWASDVTEEGLKKALSNLLDANDFRNLKLASMLRAREDWLIGMNLSRAASIAAQTKVPEGRVLSATLRLIVDRELEIRNFVPQDYFEVKARFEKDGQVYDGTMLVPPELKDVKFSDKKEAQAKLDAVAASGQVISVEQKKQTIKAPSLYSLVELQKDAAKYFGFKADKTLKIAQDLYQTHKILTYPRSESRFLPTTMVKEIWDHLKPIASIPELAGYVNALTPAAVDPVMKSKSYVDNAKITDHHAIIPTAKAPELDKLSQDELAVYTLVCKRLLAIFMPPYVSLRTAVITQTDDGSRFRTNGKVVQDPGYTVLYPSQKKDVILPPLKEKDRVAVKKKAVVSGQTKPPVRYNTATLLDAMMTAGQKVPSAEMRQILRDTSGLGTAATRDRILKKLEEYSYVVIQRQSFVPTDFGMAVVENFGKCGVYSPILTAEWEKKLRAVEDGKMDEKAFMKEAVAYVRTETANALNTKCNLKMLVYPIIGKCPFCGKPMRSYKNYFVCEEYKHGDHPCIGCFNKDFFGHRISDADMRKMLSGTPTKEYELHSEKSGKTWKSGIMFDQESKRIRIAVSGSTVEKSPVSTSAPAAREEICKCPVCGGSIIKGKNYYICSNKGDNGCTFSCKIDMSGYEVTPDDIKETIANGTTKEMRDFIWGSGKKGKAYLCFDGKRITYKFR